MDKVLKAIIHMDHVRIDDTFALSSESNYNELINILEEENIPHKKAEDSYAGIYMIKILKKQFTNKIRHGII